MAQLYAGTLRHRITIQRKEHSQNPVTGEMTHTWKDVYRDIPASVEPLSVREYLSAQSLQSNVSLRVKIRHAPGLTADMRILHGDKVYNPAGWLPDPESGLVYLTAPCSEGVNDG